MALMIDLLPFVSLIQHDSKKYAIIKMSLLCRLGRDPTFGSYHNPPFADNSRLILLSIHIRDRKHLTQIQVSIIKYVWRTEA
jgi:hypothetical protein